jgi:hypothetical protein
MSINPNGKADQAKKLLCHEHQVHLSECFPIHYAQAASHLVAVGVEGVLADDPVIVLPCRHVIRRPGKGKVRQLCLSCGKQWELTLDRNGSWNAQEVRGK